MVENKLVIKKSEIGTVDHRVIIVSAIHDKLPETIKQKLLHKPFKKGVLVQLPIITELELAWDAWVTTKKATVGTCQLPESLKELIQSALDIEVVITDG
jgi:hypothetical protein